MSHKKKGIYGLTNRGNTCYLNTAIQCLSNINPLTEYFLSNKYVSELEDKLKKCKHKEKKRINEINLTIEYAKLMKALWDSKTNSSIEPKTFHELILKYDDRFVAGTQQDSQECLAFIIDYLHEGLKYDIDISYSGTSENNIDKIVIESIENLKLLLKEKYSIIIELFYGQFINKIVSLEDDKNNMVSKTFELFNMLNIPIYGKTLYDSLSKYFEREILDSNTYFDEKNKKYINAYRQIKLIKVPKYLIIALKRFGMNQFGNLSKTNNVISFPIEKLDISTYCDGYDSLDCTMRLISVGCHVGSLNSGHYFAICRYTNDNWYKYDDESVTEFNIQSNRKELYRDAYILIYEKIE
jgi:ubiquitin carboxyl-terminal hydrolase 8